MQITLLRRNENTSNIFFKHENKLLLISRDRETEEFIFTFIKL